jgi:hypothetical protein
MPSASKKQAKFMAAVAHNPAFAKKVGVPQSVGRDFNEADVGRKFREGGAMAKKPFGKETKANEMAESKLSAKKYAAGEKSEGKKGASPSKTMRMSGGGFAVEARGIGAARRQKKTEIR